MRLVGRKSSVRAVSDSVMTAKIQDLAMEEEMEEKAQANVNLKIQAIDGLTMILYFKNEVELIKWGI